MAVNSNAVLKLFSTERTSEIGGAINEKYGVGDVVFLAEFGEKFSADQDRVVGKS